MDLNDRKEQFSVAYMRAVAAVAGFSAQRPEIDKDSVDYNLAACDGDELRARPRLDVQLKCTAADILREHALRFPLSRKNYDDLRARTLVPRILLVVLVPTDISDWLLQSEDEMVVRRCGYWTNLSGAGATDNDSSVTVNVPRTQMFTPASLSELMRRIDQDGRL